MYKVILFIHLHILIRGGLIRLWDFNLKQKNELKNLLNEHLSLVVSLIITYIFGVIFAACSYASNYEAYLPLFNDSKPIFLFHTIFETLIPSTLTFAITNSFQNLIIMLRKGTNVFIYNIVSLVITFIFELFYCLTTAFPINGTIVFLNCILIILTIVFTVLSYSEAYKLTHRNHGLV